MSHHSSVESGGTDITAHAHPIDIIDDLTPQLGGNLDGTNKNITAVASLGTNAITNTTLIDTATLHSSANIDARNLNIDAATAPDIAHAGEGLQNIIQTNGAIYNDGGLGHAVLNNTFFFPSGGNIAYYRGLPLLNSVLVARARDGAGANIAIGADRAVSFGTTTAFQDRLIYDPIGLRGEKVGVAWTGIFVRPSVDNMIWSFEVHYDLDFAGKNPDNRFRLFIQHNRGGGTLRTYTLADITTNGVENVGSAKRTLNGGGFSEDIAVGDSFKFFVACDASSPTEIAACRFINWCVYITPKV